MVLHRPLAPEGRAVRVAPPKGAVPCAVASRPWVLAVTILASAMAFIDGSVVSIALPVLQGELGAGLAALQWVVNGYTLFLGALILVGGAAGDRFGRLRLFLFGTVAFALASAACALAPGVGWLIAARAAQGIGAALMVPQSLAIISAAFPPELRGRAIGTWAGASAVTTALGPAVGGLPDRELRLALGLLDQPAAGGGGGAACPRPRAGEPGAGGGAARLGGRGAGGGGGGADDPGADGAGGAGGGGAAAAGLIAAGLAAGAGFVAVERRAAAPLVPLSLFASRAFSGANAMTLFLYGALSGVLFLVPFELIGRRGMSPSGVGLVLLPLGLVIGLFARRAGALADRLGVRPFLVAGSAWWRWRRPGWRPACRGSASAWSRR